jgi:hypothetical protein
MRPNALSTFLTVMACVFAGTAPLSSDPWSGYVFGSFYWLFACLNHKIMSRID